MGTLYGVLGTLNMADLAVKAAATPPENLGLVRAAGLLLFGVFALKAALLPFYLWLPGAYAGASAPVAALFAIMTKVGAYSILRVSTLIFGAEGGPVAGLIAPWLLPLALATLAVGMLGVLAASRLRRQIAYLVVASVGSLLTAFGLGGAAGIGAGLYYLPHSTFATAALFLLADLIARRRGALDDRLDPGPVIPGAVGLGAVFFVAAVAVVGLPPLSGFLGKFMLLRAALGHPALPWVMAVVLGGGLLGLIALARSGSLLFYRPEAEAADAGRGAAWVLGPAAGDRAPGPGPGPHPLGRAHLRGGHSHRRPTAAPPGLYPGRAGDRSRGRSRIGGEPMMHRLLPHPILSLALAAIWLLLVNSASAGQILLGLLLGWAIPLFTRPFWPDPVRSAGPWPCCASSGWCSTTSSWPTSPWPGWSWGIRGGCGPPSSSCPCG